MAMEMIPVIASVDDLERAITYAEETPSARWYVARRARMLGRSEVIPEHWSPVTASAVEPLTASAEPLEEHTVTLHDTLEGLTASLHDFMSADLDFEPLLASAIDCTMIAGAFDHLDEFAEQADSVVASLAAAGRIDDGEAEQIRDTITASVRHVRTSAGAEHFGQPIGSVIKADSLATLPIEELIAQSTKGSGAAAAAAIRERRRRLERQKKFDEKGLPRGLPSVSMIAAGVRRVRTPEGEEFYGQPIGSIIVPNVYLPSGSKSFSDIKAGDFFEHENADGSKVKVRAASDAVTDGGTARVDGAIGESTSQFTQPAGKKVQTFRSAPKGAKAVLKKESPKAKLNVTDDSAEPPSPPRDPEDALDREQSTIDPTPEQMSLDELHATLEEIQASDDPDMELQQKLVDEIDKREGYVTKTSEETEAVAKADINAETSPAARILAEQAEVDAAQAELIAARNSEAKTYATEGLSEARQNAFKKWDAAVKERDAVISEIEDAGQGHLIPDNGKTIRVRSKAQKILLEDELKGQISDGMWENSSPDWQDWSSATVIVDPQNVGRNWFARKDNYQLNSKRLLDIVGDRMVDNVKEKHDSSYDDKKMRADLGDLRKIFKTKRPNHEGGVDTDPVEEAREAAPRSIVKRPADHEGAANPTGSTGANEPYRLANWTEQYRDDESMEQVLETYPDPTAQSDGWLSANMTRGSDPTYNALKREAWELRADGPGFGASKEERDAHHEKTMDLRRRIDEFWQLRKKSNMSGTELAKLREMRDADLNWGLEQLERKAAADDAPMDTKLWAKWRRDEVNRRKSAGGTSKTDVGVEQTSDDLLGGRYRDDDGQLWIVTAVSPRAVSVQRDGSSEVKQLRPESAARRIADFEAALKTDTSSKSVSPDPTKFIDDRQTSLGTVKPDAKGADPERFIPKASFADGTTPTAGDRVRDKKGRTGTVTETYQLYTAVRWDDNNKVQTVKNDRLNGGGSTSAPARPTPDEAAGKGKEVTTKTVDNSPTTDTGGAAKLPDTKSKPAPLMPKWVEGPTGGAKYEVLGETDSGTRWKVRDRAGMEMTIAKSMARATTPPKVADTTAGRSPAELILAGVYGKELRDALRRANPSWSNAQVHTVANRMAKAAGLIASGGEPTRLEIMRVNASLKAEAKKIGLR